jgi:hypothetical protein
MVKRGLSYYYQLLHGKSKAGKQLKWMIFKEFMTSNAPSTSTGILPSILMVMSAKHNIAHFFNPFISPSLLPQSPNSSMF